MHQVPFSRANARELRFRFFEQCVESSVGSQPVSLPFDVGFLKSSWLNQVKYSEPEKIKIFAGYFLALMMSYH